MAVGVDVDVAVSVVVGPYEHLAAQDMTSEDAIRSEHQRQAAAQVSVANVITSLRLCSTLDWSQYFEDVSPVERVLQRDPAGVYSAMDFLTRDRYRQAVEELAEPTGEAQLRDDVERRRLALRPYSCRPHRSRPLRDRRVGQLPGPVR